MLQLSWIIDLSHKHKAGCKCHCSTSIVVKPLPVGKRSGVQIPLAPGYDLYSKKKKRWDILYVVSVVSRFMSDPRIHYEAVKRVLGYLQGTKNFDIKHTTGEDNTLSVAVTTTEKDASTTIKALQDMHSL